MKQKQWLKILVPVLVLAAVVGIWAVKNGSAQNGQGTQAAQSAQSSGDTGDTSASQNPDFVLDTDTIDMKQLTSYGVPIIIDFGADWCGPCQQFAPILEAAHDKVGENAIIKYVDVDKSSDLANQYPVKVIPTQVFFNADGTPYVPGDSIKTQFINYADSSGTHVFTAHEGGLTADELDAILADMGVAQ